MTTPVETELRTACADACGASLLASEINQHGWQFLEIQRRYRCPRCFRALAGAVSIKGAAAQSFIDPLPPDSIGAIRKATAATISSPTVKG